MKKFELAVAAMVIGSTFSSVTFANNTYLGGKLGYSSFSDACYLNKPCDETSFAASIHLGYNFNEYFAAEYGVDHLGNFEANFNNGDQNAINGDLWTLTLAPKFNIPLTDYWNLFAKVGAAYMMAGDETDIIPTGSLGSEYKIDHNWSFRAEYQRYQNMSDNIIKNMDANYFGIGFNYKLGSEPVVREKVVETRPSTNVVELVHPTQITTVHFGLESSKVIDTSSLSQTIDILNSYPQAKVEILGYSDTTGSVDYNQKLTTQRAEAVSGKLQAEGIKSNRMIVKGMGDANPVASNETREGREMNRRVELIIPTFKYEITEHVK